jgi:predicted 2-oxoglutarate/Fe(II)-dependent dioxygenase YbiX
MCSANFTNELLNSLNACLSDNRLLLFFFVVPYSPHTGVEMHYDGCHLTTTIMLSDRSEYQGGGTYFRALRKTIKLRKGQVLVHPGDLYHKGVDISKGKRKMIVCFMDGFKPDIHDNSLESDDRKEYEEHVIKT